MECGATVHTGGLPDGLRRRTASILAGIAAGLLCGLAQAQEVKTLRWTPPTERTDGAALSADQLAAHRVLCEPGVDVSVPMPTTSWAGVEPGITSCVVRAVDQDGIESADSERVFVQWEPDPEPDAPGQPVGLDVSVVELPPSTGPPDGSGAAVFYVNWQGTKDGSNNYTLASPELPDELVLGLGTAWTVNSVGAYGDMRLVERLSAAYADISSPTLSPPAVVGYEGFSFLLFLDPKTFDSGDSAAPEFFSVGSSAGGGFGGGRAWLARRISTGNLEFYCGWDGYGSEAGFAVAWPTTGSWIWVALDPDNATAGNRLRYKIWEYGDPVPESWTAGSSSGSAATSGTFSDLDVIQLGRRDSSTDPIGFGTIVVSPDLDEDMTAFLPAGGGTTVEAGLETGAPVLAASVGVERTVSAALSVPAATLAGASDIERQAAVDLNLAALQLNADAGIIREASAALGIAPLELAASGSVERNASVALVVPQPTLEASAGAGRQVSAALEIAAPELLSDVMIERSVSAALDIPAATLAANLGADKTVAAALITPSPALASQVSVVRLASGELALAVPVLAASAIGEELTVSGTLQTPVPVLDMDAMISRTASGALELALPVLDGTASRSANVEAVLIVRAPEMAAQAAIERFVSGELTIAELELAAQAFQGAIQPVIGLRATVRQIGYRSGVTMIGKKGTIQ